MSLPQAVAVMRGVSPWVLQTLQGPELLSTGWLLALELAPSLAVAAPAAAPAVEAEAEADVFPLSAWSMAWTRSTLPAGSEEELRQPNINALLPPWLVTRSTAAPARMRSLA